MCALRVVRACYFLPVLICTRVVSGSVVSRISEEDKCNLLYYESFWRVRRYARMGGGREPQNRRGGMTITTSHFWWPDVSVSVCESVLDERKSVHAERKQVQA